MKIGRWKKFKRLVNGNNVRNKLKSTLQTSKCYSYIKQNSKGNKTKQRAQMKDVK